MPAPRSPTQSRRNRVQPVNKQDDRVKGLISFSIQVKTALSTGFDDRSTTGLLDEFDKHLSLASKSLSAQSRQHHQGGLNKNGTDLWNQCIHLRRSEHTDVPQKRKTLVEQATVLAFFILALPYKTPTLGREDAMRLLRIAVNAARHCLAGQIFPLAEGILQKAADYISRLQDLVKEGAIKDEDEVQDCNKLEADYIALRALHSWRIDRIEVAEYVFGGAESLFPSLDADSAERLAEALFKIGSNYASRLDLPQASKWLARSLKVLSLQAIDQLSRDGVELRIAISQKLVHVHMQTKTEESLAAANDLVTYLEQEIGDRPVILILRLELIQQEPDETFDAETYAAMLKRMARSFINNENNFKLILHHIKSLAQKSYHLGCTVLDNFLLTKLLDVDRHRWAEKALVTRIWMTTSHSDDEHTASGLTKLLDSLSDGFFILGPDAAMAGQSLIWNMVENTYSRQSFDLSEIWCKLTLHLVFQKTGPANAVKIARKLINCALSKNDLDLAKTVFYEMPDEAQNQPETRYLIHKIAVRTGDEELASECLEHISQSKDDKFLYACTMDAASSNERLCALKALRLLAGKYDFAAPKLHLPALLRCVIKLGMGLLKDKDEKGKNKSEDEEVAAGALKEQVCETFEGAAEAISRYPADEHGKKLFTVSELDWFCRNAYNISVQHMFTWTTGISLRLLAACLTIISCYPASISAEVDQDLSLKSAFCHFISATLRLVAARPEDDVKIQLQHYLELRKHVAFYDEIVQSGAVTGGQSGGVDKEAKDDLNAKLVTLLVFDFEAAIALKKYEELGQVVRKAQGIGDTAAYQAMGDCLLRGKVPGDAMASTMRLIINEIWQLEQFDLARLIKYFRCMFQAALPSKDEVAMALLDDLTKKVKEGNSLLPSTTELQYLAAVSFNRGVDLYGAGDSDRCWRWAERALNLAEYVDDGGVMRNDLQGKAGMLMRGTSSEMRWDKGFGR